MKADFSTARALAQAGLLLCASTQACAGGVIGDIVNIVAPGVGTQLDRAHAQIKNAIPPYKALEEGASKVVNESLVQTTAPLLQELIARSRDDALRSGVDLMPLDIRRNLSGFLPDRVLDAARYRVKGGGDLSLQVNAIRYGDAQAITLDYVIVFRELQDALYNPALWAHELTHIDQFQRWGLRDFSIRYVRNHHTVEAEAYDAGTRYMAWTAVRNTNQWSSSGIPIQAATAVNRPVAPLPFNGNSSTCGTPVMACQVNGSAPVGTPCWCNTPVGGAPGSLIPNMLAAAPTVAPAPPPFPPAAAGLFPSGFGMQVCGCWGPNPVPFAREPRCASGAVRVNVCQGFCAPGHPLYAYVCQ